ncbi:hypothetical protein [Camelimonas lactis]|uniref:Uncharacterized protein n=1 Tax=Camelimonas lactis TaxID=659006 RepID=A0A4R2GRL5_9HYPH|nr:hypothetical protein [Camelimonas lactis]TCO12447.1 hypothetical protein EV666_10994 [Camelimonas lactis]
MTKYIGIFEKYIPSSDASELYREMSAKGAIFHRNENGEDWYAGIPARTVGSLILSVDADSVVRCVGFGPDGFSPPVGQRVYEVEVPGVSPTQDIANYAGFLGHTFDPATGSFTPPPPPAPPAIADISRQQCAMRMCQMGLIGPEDMVAMAQSGTPPAMVENMLGAMAEPDQSFARAAFAKNTYSRADPLLVLMMTGQPVPVPGGDPRPATADDIDQFFRDAALL